MNTESERNQNSFFKPIIIIPFIIQFVIYSSAITASFVSLKSKVDKNAKELEKNNLYQLNTKLDALSTSVINLTNSFNDFTTKYWENRVADAEKRANR